MAKNISKPKAVLLDIEGTTTDTHFISRDLFPLIKKNWDKFLEQTYDSPETQEFIRKLRQMQKSGTFPGLPTIVIGNKKQVSRSAADCIKWLTKNKKNPTELKSLELLSWLWAYQNGLIKAHVYEDVSPSLHNWKTKSGIKVYVYSSALIIAQKLTFVNTIHGNLLPLIDDFFDNSIGNKTDVESYKLIAQKIGVEGNQILFITDEPKEAKTTINAGLKAAVIKRPGNKSKDQNPDIPRINSFADLKF